MRRKLFILTTAALILTACYPDEWPEDLRTELYMTNYYHEAICCPVARTACGNETLSVPQMETEGESFESMCVPAMSEGVILSSNGMKNVKNLTQYFFRTAADSVAVYVVAQSTIDTLREAKSEAEVLWRDQRYMQVYYLSKEEIRALNYQLSFPPTPNMQSIRMTPAYGTYGTVGVVR